MYQGFSQGIPTKGMMPLTSRWMVARLFTAYMFVVILIVTVARLLILW